MRESSIRVAIDKLDDLRAAIIALDLATIKGDEGKTEYGLLEHTNALESMVTDLVATVERVEALEAELEAATVWGQACDDVRHELEVQLSESRRLLAEAGEWEEVPPSEYATDSEYVIMLDRHTAIESEWRIQRRRSGATSGGQE